MDNERQLSSYVLRDTCEERKERFEQMFSDIIKRLENIEKKLSANSNGKLVLRMTGIMIAICTLAVTLVAVIVNYVK